MDHTWLEKANWVSQCLLLLVAISAAGVAYVQLRTAKLFELLKILEDQNIRRARRDLYQKVVEGNCKGTNWWETDQDLETAASAICASYDIVGLMAKGRVRRFFSRHWTHNICWTHEALEGYLALRRKSDPNSYQWYEKLYREAKQFRSQKT